MVTLKVILMVGSSWFDVWMWPCVFQSAEEQLNRQLDWCIEQLEVGMKTQKGTPKQSMTFNLPHRQMFSISRYSMLIWYFLPAEEEASRALKTLQSSKAPLAKKRQVMRAMNGDYRKKMEEEKSKQYKLIKSGEWNCSSDLNIKNYSWTTKGLFKFRPSAVKWQISPIPTEIASSQVKVVPNSPKKSVFHRKAEVQTQTAATEENLQQDTDLKAQTQEETSAFVFTPSKEEFRFNFLWFVRWRHVSPHVMLDCGLYWRKTIAYNHIFKIFICWSLVPYI